MFTGCLHVHFLVDMFIPKRGPQIRKSHRKWKQCKKIKLELIHFKQLGAFPKSQWKCLVMILREMTDETFMAEIQFCKLYAV